MMSIALLFLVLFFLAIGMVIGNMAYQFLESMDDDNDEVEHSELFIRALEVFGDRDLALEWLSRPHGFLDGHVPIVYHDKKKVFELLKRIEDHGNF